MFDNMIAVQHQDWFKERESRGLSNNYLVPVEQANNLCIHSWVKYDRLNKESVKKEISNAEKNDRFIAVSFHKENELNDCYENYVSVDRAIELVNDKELFVFKFIVLSKRISDEYKLLGV